MNSVKQAAIQEAEKYLQQTYGTDTRLFYLYKLMTNDMRSVKVEFRECVAIGRSKEALMAFEKFERVDPYTDKERHDGRGSFWGKNYRQGGPLEWCNPCYIELFEPDSQWPMRELIRKVTGVHHVGDFRAFTVNEWIW